MKSTRKHGLENLRRLDALVETYGFGNYSIDIAFAFKTLGVRQVRKTSTCIGQ